MEEVDLVLSSSYISVFKVSWSEPRVKTNSYLHSYNNIIVLQKVVITVVQAAL